MSQVTSSIHRSMQFIGNAVHWDKWRDTTSERVQSIACATVAIGGTAFLSYAFPKISRRVYYITSIVSLGLGVRNLAMLRIQECLRADNAQIDQCGESMNENKKYFESYRKYSFVQLISLKLTRWPRPYDLVDLFILLGISSIGVVYFEQHIIAQGELCEPRLLKQELELLKRIYPEKDKEAIRELCLLEAERRFKAREYFQKKENWIANAWEDLLSVGTFTVEDSDKGLVEVRFTVEHGVEGDVEIYEPLVTAAVERELEKFVWSDENIPPSLIKRFEKLRRLKEESWAEAERSKEISSIARPMLQEAELFQDALFYGASRYCLKHFKFCSLATVISARLQVISRRLLFEPVPLLEE